MAFMMADEEMLEIKELLVKPYDLSDQEFDDFLVHLRIKGDATMGDVRIIHSGAINDIMSMEWTKDLDYVGGLDSALLAYATGWPHELIDVLQDGAGENIFQFLGELIAEHELLQNVAEHYIGHNYEYGFWFAPDDLRTHEIGAWLAFNIKRKDR